MSLNKPNQKRLIQKQLETTNIDIFTGKEFTVKENNKLDGEFIVYS